MTKNLNEWERMYDDLSIFTTTSGRNKNPDEFNILQEYLERFKEKPSVTRNFNHSSDYYHYNNFIKELKNNFPKCKIIFEDSTYYYKYEKSINRKEILFLEDGYLLLIECDFAFNLYNNPKIDIGISDDKGKLIEYHEILKPPFGSKLRNDDIDKKIIDIFRKTKVDYKDERISIGMVSMENGELFIEDFYLDDKIQEMVYPDLHYGKNFENFHKKLVNKLKTNTKGLVLLHGVPGTGKTFYIRQLLKELTKTNANILYFSPAMVDSITDPSFINFIAEWSNSFDDKKGIILIEDAEPLLESRQTGRNMGITNLLNLTDGLLNDILGVQIIATFNIDIQNIDPALMRPERLIARKEFIKLNKANSLKLAKKIGISEKSIDKIINNNKDKKVTLADIYALKKNNEILEHAIEPDKKKIGF